MKTSRRFVANVLPLLVLVTLAGCAAGRGVNEGTGAAAVGAEQDGAVHSNQVYVLVDGRERGALPTTVRVRRGMGARVVSLWRAGEEFRTYELQTVHTADGLSMTYSFFGESDAASTVYDVSTLPTDGDDTFIVPYSPQRLTIEDREYGLTLIVEE